MDCLQDEPRIRITCSGDSQVFIYIKPKYTSNPNRARAQAITPLVDPIAHKPTSMSYRKRDCGIRTA